MEFESGSREDSDSVDGSGAVALPETGQQMEGEKSESVATGSATSPRPFHLTRSVYIRHIPCQSVSQ